MATFRADSVGDAVVLATQFKRLGLYDLFRGQREDWPVRSSWARLTPEALDQAQQRISLFFSWIESHPELGEFTDRQDQNTVDQKLALAQHYGISTNFCDFTTDPGVAGFFASSEAGSQQNAPSVIVCCNLKKLLAFCEEELAEDSLRPDVLRLSFPTFGALLQLLWDGLRRVPYADNDLATAMANGAFLASSLLEAVNAEIQTRDRSHIAAKLLQKPLKVEFGRAIRPRVAPL